MFKIDETKLIKFLKDNANINHSKGTTIEEFDYVSKYNAYYIMHTGSNFMMVNSCSDGEINDKGQYVLNCKIYERDINLQTTLKKNGNNYVFISNKCSGSECSFLPGNLS